MHPRGARVVSICTGAFALAAAGLLDGRPATTHWRWTDELQRRYPEVDVLPNRLFVDDGDILTSAGVTAGRDGLLTRTAHAEVPPRVEYELTALGHSLAGPTTAVTAWAEEHMRNITRARDRYDRRAA